MKIFFPIAAFYPSQVGGPCNTVYWHTSALNKNNVLLRIVTTDHGIKDGEIPKNIELQNDSGSVIYFSKRKLPLKALKKIRVDIKWADIIHLNSLFSLFSIYSFFYIKLFHSNKKIVWSTRGETNPNALYFSSWKKKLILPFYKRLRDNIIFHSTSDKETVDIRKVFPKSRIIQLPNYIQMAPRISLPIQKQLIFVGRIHPIKGLHKLIKAISLSETFKEAKFKLFIVGKVEDRNKFYINELNELIKSLNLINSVEFKDHISGYEKESLYANSYALVLPSETENFGNVVVESLNQGTPVIASLGTPWKELVDYKCGFHVSNDPHELAKSIDEIISLSSDEYSEWRDNAKKLVDDNYNIDTQIYKWIDFYKRNG